MSAYSDAVISARRAFDLAAQEGFQFNVLDIGGGFPGQEGADITFESVGQELRRSLDEHFPESCGVRLIGEPGTFYVASAYTLAANVIGKQPIDDGKHGLSNW